MKGQEPSFGGSPEGADNERRVGLFKSRVLLALSIICVSMLGWFAVPNDASATKITSLKPIVLPSQLAKFAEAPSIKHCDINTNAIKYSEVSASAWHRMGGLSFAEIRLACASGSPLVSILADSKRRAIISLTLKR